MQKFNCHLVRLICFLEQVASWWCIVMRGNPTVWRKRFRFFVDPRFLLAGRFSSIISIVAAWAQPISIFIPNFVDSCRRPPRSPSATSSTYRSWLHPHPWPLRGGSGKPITWTKEPRTGHLPEKQKNPTVPLYKIKAVFHCLSIGWICQLDSHLGWCWKNLYRCMKLPVPLHRSSPQLWVAISSLPPFLVDNCSSYIVSLGPTLSLLQKNISLMNRHITPIALPHRCHEMKSSN